MIGGKGGNAMSEEKRMPVLTGQKKQIFYTGLVYLLVCFMTAGVTVFLTKEKKDEVKEVSAVVTEEPKVNTQRWKPIHFWRTGTKSLRMQ